MGYNNFLDARGMEREAKRLKLNHDAPVGKIGSKEAFDLSKGLERGFPVEWINLFDEEAPVFQVSLVLS